MAATTEIETKAYRPRIRAFRASIIEQLPRAPRDKTSLALLNEKPTRQLISLFVNWRIRLLPARPRVVTLWSSGVTTAQLEESWSELQPLLEKVKRGEDLTPNLSTSVENKGVVLAGANPADKGKDLDSVLIRTGLHHFHIGVAGPGNPKGRSDRLVFAEVLSDEFRVVAISNHGAFERGSPDHQRFHEICRRYIERDMAPGQGYMANPVMSSGHSMVTIGFGLRCENEIERLDPLLDNAEFVRTLYNDQSIFVGLAQEARPKKTNFAWHFDDLKFGVLEKRTNVFFCRFPFFDR